MNIDLKTFFERILEERQKNYEERFHALQAAMDASHTAQKEAMIIAFTSSEKAILKAETATDKRFEAMNGFRAAMADQTKTYIPRNEVLALTTSLEGKIEALRKLIEKNSDAHSQAEADLRLAMTQLLSLSAYETRHEELQRQVNDLRASHSSAVGRSLGASQLWSYIIAASGILVATASVIFAIIFHFAT